MRGWGSDMLNWIVSGGRTRPSLGAAREPLSFSGRSVAVLVLLATIGFSSLGGVVEVRAQGARATDNETAPIRRISVTLFKSRTIRMDQPFATAIIAAPEIADVLPMSDRSLYIQGKKIGTTNLSVFDTSMRVVAVLDIEVTPDTGNLREKIGASSGAGGIHVSSSNGQVVLSGQARDAVAADRAVSVAKGLSPETPIVNAMQVAASQQVMLKVRFLEVSRDAGRQLGVIWFVASGGRGVSTGAGVAAVSQVPGTGTATGGSAIPLFQAVGALAGATGSPFGVALANLVNKGTSVDVMISALETKA